MLLSKKIVVTGAAGFIGSNLSRMLLSEGYHVIGIDNLSAGILENLPRGIEFYRADICDSAFSSFSYLKDVEAIFHLAAKNCLADCAADPVATSLNNVVGTAKVMTAAVQNKIPHVIYADTSAEYEGVEEFPSKVDNVKPLSIYACSKRGGALLAKGFEQYSSIKVTTVRYFNVYGPAQDWRRSIPPIMSAFSQKLLEGKRPVIYGTGEKRRDFIHVDDVNRFHLLLLKRPDLRGGTYNLGSGKDFSVLEIYELIEAQIKSGLKPEHKPELPGEALRTLADLTESRAAGWEPRVDLKEGISAFIKATRERLASA